MDKNTWTENSPKKIADCKSLWKICSTSCVIRELQWRQQWNTTIHLLKWIKPQILTPPSSDQGVEEQKLSFIVSVRANNTTTLEGILEVSYKAKLNRLTMQSSNCAPKYLHKWVDKLYLHTQKVFIAALVIIAIIWKQANILQQVSW